ncbi:serine/threonine-protein kinase [Leptolyngbya sp. FACHB-261]|uniref:serine/threonine-protein kinase n=1 Tax=Leptolyngbya sp. FACHB-261 TaxID=2692806 RepID=UPI001684104A|nr:serine/threonine-protein kinase [Leptolyngbya sp. FACHB-261]MBD2104055.1 protein kinase [Leptolyngbya sp. FACHB-261]
MIGELLDGRYQIARALGAGGFGQTYVALDTRRPGNPTCVVKHLQPASRDPQSLQTARRLFKSEAETLERLGQHDQIPRLLAYFEENQEFYLVQDFIEGQTLSAELQLGQRWSEAQVVAMLEDVLGILHFVHSQGVIHRDIKPDNIIRRQPDRRLVLVDFGSVKQVRTQQVTVEGHLNATVAIGTPGYMPNEQGLGKPRFNSDLYGLGMIAIQALTGFPPTQLPDDTETGELIWQPHAQASPALAAVLSQMVHYHFKDRYQSATEVLQALKRLSQTHVVLPPVASPPLGQAAPYPTSAPQTQTPPTQMPSGLPLSRQATVPFAPANPGPPPGSPAGGTQVVSPPSPPKSPNSASSTKRLPLLIGATLGAAVVGFMVAYKPDARDPASNPAQPNPDNTASPAPDSGFFSNPMIRSRPESGQDSRQDAGQDSRQDSEQPRQQEREPRQPRETETEQPEQGQQPQTEDQSIPETTPETNTPEPVQPDQPATPAAPQSQPQPSAQEIAPEPEPQPSSEPEPAPIPSPAESPPQPQSNRARPRTTAEADRQSRSESQQAYCYANSNGQLVYEGPWSGAGGDFGLGPSGVICQDSRR